MHGQQNIKKNIDVTLAVPVADIGQARNRYKIEAGNNNLRYRLIQCRVEWRTVVSTDEPSCGRN